MGGFLTLVTLAVYAPVRHHDFINFDDPIYVTHNSWVASGISSQSLRWAFSQMHASNWHPLTWVSHMLDCEWFGVDPGAHHLVNAGLHAGNTLLLFLLLRLMTGTLWRSGFVAALFALHPLHVESVAWIAERKDVLSAFFGLLTLIAYVKYAQPRVRPKAMPLDTSPNPLPGRSGEGERADDEPLQARRAPVLHSIAEGGRSDAPYRHPLSSRWYWLALVCFALGLMSKPMLVTWPFVMLLLDYWPLGRVVKMENGRWKREDGGWKRAVVGWRPLITEKLPFFALSAASCLITFLAQSHGGAVASLERTSILSRCWNSVMAYAGYLVKTFWPVDLAILYLPPEQSSLELALLALAILLLITLFVLWQARRRAYLATGWFWFGGTLVPVIGLVQVGSQSMADRYTYVPLIGVFILLAWGGWDVIKRRPRARTTAGVLMGASLLACVVMTSRQLQHWRNSETLFTHCLRVTQNNFVVHNHLGSAYFMTGRTAEAEVQYRESLRIRPTYSDAHLNLGALLTQLGRVEEAMNHLQEAVRLAPKYADSYGKLGLALGVTGRHAEAIRYYREAIRLKPDLAEALNNLAWILATHPDDQLRNGTEAVRLAERGCELTGWRETIYIGTLAAAYAEAGRYDDAVATADRARALALKKGEETLAARNAELRRLYQARRPYREPPPEQRE